MGIIEPKIRFLSNRAIEAKAQQFLARWHPDGTVPVPIEHIIGVKMRIDIIPTPGLREGLRESANVDALISQDLEQIHVDQRVSEKNENRYRFSLAHEIEHAVLHPSIWRALPYTSVAEWKRVIQSALDDNEYSLLERHANVFAGFVLVPGAPLRARFDAAIAMARLQGVNMDNPSGNIRGMVAEFIAKDFGVSAQAASIRLDQDELWYDLGR